MNRSVPRFIAPVLLCLLIAGRDGWSKVEQDAKDVEAFEATKEKHGKVNRHYT